MKTPGLLISVNILLATLVAFLTIFQGEISDETIIQVLGRFHPVVLHLPIGFTAFLILYSLFGKKLDHLQIESAMLQWTIFTALVSAAFGVVLSVESETMSTDVLYHRNLALVYCAALIGLYFIYKTTVKSGQRLWYNLGLAITSIFLIIASHKGASITHGEDFLTSPIQKKQTKEINELFTEGIIPILESKCISCHKPSRSKGELILTSYEDIMNGGENGQIVMPSQPDGSEMISRLKLPLEHDDHMPPEDKTQLTETEIKVLEEWIALGAPEELPIVEIESGHPILTTIDELQEHSTSDSYDFKPAKKTLIEKLNTPFRSVTPVYPGSPALEASIFVASTYTPDLLKDLTAVKQQLVSLNLSNLPVSDDDFGIISEFVNLEELIANGTQVTGAGIEKVLQNTQLKSLAMASTAITIQDLMSLANHPSLQSIYAWNTNITEKDCDEFERNASGCKIILGYSSDSEPPISLTPPILENGGSVFGQTDKIQLTSSFPGVNIHYTLDGSEPDSTSALYEEPLEFSRFLEVKARSYKSNWKASSVASYSVYKEGVLPRTVTLQIEPNQRYRADGAATLKNNTRGDIINFAAEWLGYRESEFDALFDFGVSPPSFTQCVFGYGENISSYIMPPVTVKIYGGNSPANLELVASINPIQPDGYRSPSEKSILFDLPGTQFRFYRFVAKPVSYLPRWHNGHKDKGWVFVDEVLFYE